MTTMHAPGSGITTGPLARIPFPERTLSDLLGREARRRPDDVLFTHERRDHTVGELDARVEAAARNLADRGIGPGSRVALLMASTPEYLVSWFAVARLGAVEVPINTAYRGELLRYQLNTARVDLAVADTGPLLDAVESVRAEVPTLGEVLGFPGTYSDVLEAAPVRGRTPGPGPAPDDIASVLYTSGTTGPSKGVLLTHHQQLAFGHLFTEITDLGPDDVLLNYSPFFHISGKFATLGCLLTGARMVLRSRLSIERFWDEAREFGVTAFIAIGGVCHMLHGRAPRPDDADNPVRVVYAVPAPAEIYHDFEKRFGLTLVEAYGSTETNLIVNSALDESLPGSCGRPNPIFDVRVVDEDGAEVDAGIPGEVVVSCPDPLLLSAGYDGMPEITATAWRGGRFHTGDRAVRDATGALWFKDRIKDSIRRRGENISSYEVERLVNGHPAVAESAAVGAPSELGEEEVRAVVVLRAGASVSAEDLFLHYAESMPYHMVPRFIDIVAELPRTPTDKVEKYKLRTQGAGENSWDAVAAGWRMTREGPVRADRA
ncbi:MULTISPECIES: AMP-binding protein [Pseudonocardia]|uniref:Long-chain-fatty-acid--CoA ligase n=2 Tax=Pseudonocardia TaxID=1847 RepID=A0A1Y2MHY3_PSEAH|nr:MULTISPECIES: AMP-binding protein [Pseudonocardia]OSY34895.1 Long-chain-fatty-acid--CoA ligase [Pseudonocardia autotrophica]TDN75417.1 crotonobetaine/carnitine-CoA ligase [Pseudonocardia autotrophica]BBF99375.1 ATP-dependent acyl-CoA ligase [Pseudonocardia autotrophica]GEC29352.1 ATP-dependent acyl-CoA ligase [Pseudonocardia saturnea]